MKRLLVAVAVMLAAAPAIAKDSTHPYKTSKGKIIDMPWWETMASCYGQLQALSKYAEDSSADAAKKLGDYSNIAFNLALKRLTDERGISVEEAQKLVIPNAKQAAQLTSQGFAIYKMTGNVDEKNNEIINGCFDDFNAYAKSFPGELK